MRKEEAMQILSIIAGSVLSIGNLPSLKSWYTIESGKHVRGPDSNLMKFGPVEGFDPKHSTGPLRLSYGARSLPKMAF